jgi:Flp pilus assembly protein TadG
MGKKWSFTKRPASTMCMSNFARSRTGNVAILYALCASVLMGLLGLTVDFTRAQTLRSQMQNAADGAALVAERSSSLSLARRKELAEAFFNAEMGSDIPGMNFDVIELDSGGHRATASYPMPLTLAALVRNEPWTISVAAEAEAQASPPIEVVLALDNTGSMEDDMDTLREGAEDLVEYLLSIDGDTVSVGLVPFVAQVNIGTSHSSWIDQAGTNPYNGILLEGRYLGVRDNSNHKANGNCTSSTTTYPTTYGGVPVRWIQGDSAYPSPATDNKRCYAFSPASVNMWSLYANLPSNAQWGGCVEMRPPPYDINDTAPTTGTGATMFVPFFSLDDGGDVSNRVNDWITNTTYDRQNQIGLSGSPTWTQASASTMRTLGVYKYRSGVPVSVNTDNDNGRGPNRGCPTPIVPLTSSESTVVNAVRAMDYWNGGGTNQIEGLAWAWRVLSPTAPFTEGRPYNDPTDPVRKVIVLFTDGDNTSLNNVNPELASDYAGLGYRSLWQTYQTAQVPTISGSTMTWNAALASQWRRSITGASSAVTYMNTRQLTLCQAIKDAGVEIYTVGFRISAGGTADELLQDCATQDGGHFFHADSQEELLQAFRAIGSGIGELRITR